MARLEQEAARHPGAARRPGRPRWTNPYLLTATVAAVAVIVLATTTLFTGGDGNPLRPGGQEPELITASEVRARVAGALAALDTLRGEITVECEAFSFLCQPPEAGGRATVQWSFVATAEGDERTTGIGTADDIAFSSETRTYREVVDEGSRPRATELANTPAGPPDFTIRRSPLTRQLASVVRAFITDTSEVPVTDVVEQGRPAWRLVTPVPINKLAGPGGSPDQLEVVVDRESGFPLRITETLEGRFLQEVRLSGLVADEPVDRSMFDFDFPAGLDVFHQDVGFEQGTLDQAAATVGYQPVLPTWLPDGYQRAEVTFASQGGRTGAEGANPAGAGVVSVAYRRGFDRIVVSTRVKIGPRCKDLAPPIQEDCWADPLASGEGFIDEPVPFVIGSGALAGANAELVVVATGIPHVWAIDDRLVVTVAGDASGDELRRIAGSFAVTG
jgi:hypothetical protein